MMPQLSIDYSNKGGAMKYIVLFFSIYAGLFALYVSAKEAMAGSYGFWFVCSSILVVLSLIVILVLVLKKEKPLVVINNESIVFNLDRKKTVVCLWADIKEIKIGISSVKIELNSLSKPIDTDLSMLKYNDLKEVKSLLIELCENREIPFSNC